ncbi:hypothetical protein BT96DRAFT_1007308 [Gymnopus androsaceus JB14]|uniref:Uncharacterized protein n=1 Tax=Gymnopus androsaceus JB14 TaxID=1447944 RepID=A0A6A4GHZ9_9AGAR|nr:hypothetical protein BT96DRAFT_1007308 [Gymnopus androsaceus JB14]
MPESWEDNFMDPMFMAAAQDLVAKKLMTIAGMRDDELLQVALNVIDDHPHSHNSVDNMQYGEDVEEAQSAPHPSWETNKTFKSKRIIESSEDDNEPVKKHQCLSDSGGTQEKAKAKCRTSEGVILQPTENGLQRQSGKKHSRLDRELFGDPNDSLRIGGREGYATIPEQFAGSWVVQHDIRFINEALQKLRFRMDKELGSLASRCRLTAGRLPPSGA